MKTSIIIAGLAGLVLLAPKSSSQTKKSNDKGLDGLTTKPKDVKCTDLQYKDDKGKCIDFWVEGETDQFVLDEINNQIQKLKDQTIDALCADKVINADMGEYAPNDNMMTIVKETIHKLWPVISVNELPPKSKSPDWLKKIWMKTNSIYSTKICGGGVG
jgi:gas vesicle protein